MPGREPAAQPLGEPAPPLRAEGLFRRTAPFVAPAVFAVLGLNPDAAGLEHPARSVAVLVALVVVGSFLLLPWERLPRWVPAVTVIAAFALELWPAGAGAVSTALTLAGIAAMAVVALSLYVAPWESLPRWLQSLPPLGALVSVLLLRVGLDVPSEIAFPAVILVVLWAALHHTRAELGAALVVTAGVFLAPTPSEPLPHEVFARLLFVLLAGVIGATVQSLVASARGRSAELDALREVARGLSSTLDLDVVLGEVVRAAVAIVSRPASRGVRSTVLRLEGEVLRSVAEHAPADAQRFGGRLYPLDSHPLLATVVRERSVRTGEMTATPMTEETRAAVSRAGITTYAILPLVVDDEVFGALTVSATSRPGFTPRETERLVAVTDVAALAIRNAEAYRRERRMAHGLAGLVGAGLALTQETDVVRVLDVVARRACELLDAGAAAVTLLSADGRRSERVVTSRQGGSEAALRLAADPEVVTGVLRSRARERSADVETAEGLVLLGSALRVRRDVVGCVCAVHENGRRFSAEDAVLLDGLAAQAAVAVANARLLERLGELATTDPLTGARNRREFERCLAALPRKPFAVLAIDVDDLKAVNDEFGHEAGDVIIQVVGATLGALLRGGDLVARVGGDEFAALLLDVGEDTALEVAERMRTALHGVALPHGSARVSIGCSHGPRGADPHAVWKAADEALYEAKRSGRDRTAVSLGDGRSGGVAALQSIWSETLGGVLEGHSVGMAYQPIVGLDDRGVVAYEALARPGGPRLPGGVEGLFAAAQRVGRMRDLDWLCRRAALEGSRRLPPDLPVFVNVSATALLDPIHGVDQMLLLLEWAGRSPETLVLEITERETMRDLRRLTLVAAAYREHGIRFALDDVGEGHSTLEVMAAVSPEFIKVASSLTATIDRSGSRAAVQAVTAFAATTGARVIAEGVETERAALTLRGLGVLLGQGYWLGRPGQPPRTGRGHRRAQPAGASASGGDPKRPAR